MGALVRFALGELNCSELTARIDTIMITRKGIRRFVEPVINRQPARVESPRYLREHERVVIADGSFAGKLARKIAAELGRAVSTVADSYTT